jgi:prolyl oligopeptidase
MPRVPLRTPLAILAAAAMTVAATPAALQDDPWLWLEEVEGERALAWVRERNAEAKAALEDAPGFAALRDDLRAILDSDARIPMVQKLGDHYYNYWRDARNERGLWRRTTLASYRTATPEWETVLDLDALGKAEGVNWVWAGASCLKPDYRRCLVDLSRGGADATVTREFDLVEKRFVDGGFSRPEAKGGLAWKDLNTVYVYTDFGPGSMTASGYPRIVKEWRRGTPLAEATVVYEGRPDDMYIAGWRDLTPGHERDFVSRTIAFYNDELYLRGANGALVRIDAPNDANKSVYRDWLLLELRSPWEAGGRTWPAGALVAARFDAFLAGHREVTPLFLPSPTTSLAGYTWTRDHLLVNVLDDVKNRLEVLTPAPGAWSRAPLAGAPAFGTVGAEAVDRDASNDFFLTVTDFLTPTSLAVGTVGSAPEVLKRTPAFFDATSLAITQHFATSDDGTRVPYFMVAREGAPLDGTNPTLLYGYGGFEVSLTPVYSAAVGRAWLTQGGVYVVANIRGGGEYGPRWHQAALRASRHKAYEDFAAVARDLVARGVTTPARLGIMGGSNGGLLVGNMMVLYPELFGAVVCQVPLLDMRRYHRLLAGASWMAEYGDPDSDDWTFLQRYSPYHNVRADVRYPPVLFTTSTRDDRVHPGHARKMMARMREQGHDVTYYENIEGGHGGAANNAQAAHMQALAYTFLRQRLMGSR